MNGRTLHTHARHYAGAIEKTTAVKEFSCGFSILPPSDGTTFSNLGRMNQCMDYFGLGLDEAGALNLEGG